MAWLNRNWSQRWLNFQTTKMAAAEHQRFMDRMILYGERPTGIMGQFNVPKRYSEWSNFTGSDIADAMFAVRQTEFWQ
jgi:hypothetical protein